MTPIMENSKVYGELGLSCSSWTRYVTPASPAVAANTKMIKPRLLRAL